MSGSDLSAPRSANHLLAALPPDEYDRIASRLEQLPMPVKTETMTPGEHVSHVYFPLSGAFSITALTLNGAHVEVGTVGLEGVVGTHEVLAGAPAVNRCFIHLEGEALRMPADEFRAEFGSGGAFQLFVLRFQHAFAMQISQTAACNRLHEVEHRLPRWLLMCQDRVGADELPLTHEFLSIMLGTPRPVVTRALGAVVADGAIAQGRGKVTILDRSKLEALSCECYRIVSGLYARLYNGAGA